jgi:ADP-heptose:LPS heptosyltransferase
MNACGVEYDVAVMAIPFDGRWQSGTHFRAKRVMDYRPRPEFSPELGFSSWKKHEVEYQMESARELGFTDPTPSMSFCRLPHWDDEDRDLIYLGFGFKRDAASFWSAKHWGNDRYVRFIRRCRELHPTVKFRATGSAADLAQCIIPISREVGDLGPVTANIASAIEVVGRCAAYFGNDTGMMHVAASFDVPTYGLMAYENVATKNRPWCSQWRVHEFFRGGSDPDEVAADFVDFVWGAQ